MCQTGLIEVGVNLTTVPCSYSLSAQAKSAAPSPPMQAKSGYLSSFDHSPECTRFAEVYNAESMFHAERNSEILEKLNSVKSFAYADARCERNISLDLTSYSVGGGATDFMCCGVCTLSVHEIKLLYFPGPVS